jgi:two-component system response regulator HydG
MDSARILIAHRDAATATAWSSALAAAGCAVEQAADGADAVARCRESAFTLAVLDLEVPPLGAVPVIEEVKRLRPSTIVAVSGPSSVEGILACFRAGAFDYLEEPVATETLTQLVEGALARLRMGEHRRRLAEELRAERKRVEELKRRLTPDDPFQEVVGSSLVVRDLLATLREVARTDSTVLLTGESGTGKGLLARAIHEASNRHEGPFVEANCVVYSEGVLHSELFGHERGAFTGAARQKRGRFELADGGTLFLDEIGDITPATQLLLLGVLQQRTFERVGGEETVNADVRLIAATNRDLADAMRRGTFRSDLFYRLNVIPVHVPPLREHPDDIPMLAQHFLERCAARMERQVSAFAPEALDALAAYPWPGNIRELENLVERVVVLARRERIGLADLPPALRDAAAPQGGRAAGTLEDLERRRILEVLRDTGGNKKLAASRLGIHRSTLYAKLRRFGLEEPGSPEHDAEPAAASIEA